MKDTHIYMHVCVIVVFAHILAMDWLLTCLQFCGNSSEEKMIYLEMSDEFFDTFNTFQCDQAFRYILM